MKYLRKISPKVFFKIYSYAERMCFPWQYPNVELLDPKVIFWIGNVQFLVE